MQLGYVILYVPDVAAAIGFYERAFGLERRFLHESGAYGEMETGAAALAFGSEALIDTHGFPYRRNREDAEPAGFEVSLVTDDVAGAVSRAVEEGATPLLDPEDKPWGQTVAYVRDLNGVIVELCTPVAPA